MFKCLKCAGELALYPKTKGKDADYRHYKCIKCGKRYYLSLRYNGHERVDVYVGVKKIHLWTRLNNGKKSEDQKGEENGREKRW